MTTLPVYEALAQDIKAMGVDTVFGLMSDDTALFVATLDAIGVRFCGTRHENTAIGMAEGYAASSGQLGIAVLGRGPATANAMHGATYAQRARSRVLLIFGDAPVQTPEGDYGPDTKQFNSVAALQSAGFQPFIGMNARTVRQVLAQAVGATNRGAAALLLPVDVQTALIDLDETVPVLSADHTASSRSPRGAALGAVVSLLKDSRRPLIVAGRGAHDAGAREVLIALADHLGAALSTTLKAKDMFRGHPLNCGIVGSYSHAGGRRLIEQADCILAFGAGLNKQTSSMGTAFPRDAPLIHVDRVRANIGRWLHADVAVVADVKMTAEALLALLPQRAAGEKEFLAPRFREWLAAFEISSDFKPAHTARTVDPRAVCLALDSMLPEDRNVIYDGGNFLQVVPYVSVPSPQRVKQASDFGSIGMGFGVAMGYACAAPERTTVLFVGDGGLLMTLGELETAAREGIAMVIVVLNDCAYGAEVHYLAMRDMPTAKAAFVDIDFAPVAAAFGFETATVRSMNDLHALSSLLARPGGPVLIDCKINGAIPAPFMFERK